MILGNKIFVYLNSGLVPEDEATVSVLDRGFLYGDSVFETLRVYRGRPFRLEEHLGRFSSSARALRIELPKSLDALSGAVMETVRANSLGEAYMRITLSRGVGPRGIDPTAPCEPTLVIMGREFSPPPEEQYERGVALIISKVRRNPPEAIDPAIKCGNFINNILAKAEASDRGAYDSIMLTTGGLLAECTVSNIFFLKGGALHTPATGVGILPGITRGAVMDLARMREMEVREGEFTPADLFEADEVFLTNSTTEVMPVSSIDGRGYTVGPVARELRQAYRLLVAREAD